MYHTLHPSLFKAEVTYKMIRNPDPEAAPNTIFEGEPFDHAWENFKPAPVKKGSLVLLDGKVRIFLKTVLVRKNAFLHEKSVPLLKEVPSWSKKVPF